MTRTINSSVMRAVVRAYFEGMTLDNISKVFSIRYADVINIVHAYLIGPVKKA